MMKILKMKKNGLITLLLAMVVGFCFSCNEDYPNLIKNDRENDAAVAGRAPKILYIMVDGAKGSVVQQAVKDEKIPIFSEMEKHAIYTYDGIAEFQNTFDTLTVANGWANMLTGATQAKTHADKDYADMDLEGYPTFISRLKENNPSLKTVVYASSDDLKTHFFANDPGQSFSGDDDAAVQATIDALSNKDSLSVVVTQLSAVEDAGLADEFKESSSSYVDAIVNAGSQVSDIVNALRDRESYEKENWLVIVASGNGGGDIQAPGIDNTVYEDSLRNTFMIFYNKEFQQYFVPKPRSTIGAGPYKDTAVHLYGKPNNSGEGVNVEVPTDVNQDDLNIGTGALTVEAKVKMDKNSLDRGNIPFLTKDKNRGSNGPGWSLWYNGGAVNLYINNGSTGVEYKGGAINDGKWHTVAFKAYHVGNTINTTLYTDGKVTGTATAVTGPVETSSPLRIGYNDNIFGGTPLDMLITDVRIWDKALDDDIISEYACFPGYPPASHPDLANLIGFWGVTKSTAIKDTIPDLSGNGRYALINAPGGAAVEWISFKEISDNICPNPSDLYYEKVPNSVDIPFEIFNWMSVNVPDSWDLDGKAWLTGYSDVRNPIN